MKKRKKYFDILILISLENMAIFTDHHIVYEEKKN